MRDSQELKRGMEFKSFKFVLIALVAIYGVISIWSAVLAAALLPGILKINAPGLFLGWISVICERVLPGLIFLFVAYCLFRIMRLISRGEPFDPQSPRYIRSVGYAVLALTVSNAVGDALSLPWSLEYLNTRAFSLVLLTRLGSLLLGLGFLVIARVFRIGAGLQQEQDLTV